MYALGGCIIGQTAQIVAGSYSVKRIVVALVAVVSAGAAATLGWVFVSPLWSRVEWWKSVMDWLIDSGFDRVAEHWAMAWRRFPAWCLAFLVGAVAGALSRKHWVRNALWCGVGFVCFPCLYILIRYGYTPRWSSQGFHISASMVLWDLVAVPVLLLGAWLLRVLWRKK